MKSKEAGAQGTEPEETTTSMQAKVIWFKRRNAKVRGGHRFGQANLPEGQPRYQQAKYNYYVHRAVECNGKQLQPADEQSSGKHQQDS